MRAGTAGFFERYSYMATTQAMSELKLDVDALYREDVFTDRKAGTIRQLTPIDRKGAPDAARKVLYIGEMQLLTPMGTLPLAFEIDALTLSEAADQFPALAKSAMERTVKELQQLRREAASSIVVPERGVGFGPGGIPGGGKIQLP